MGLFLSEKNKHIVARSAADQLAELFSKNGIEVIKVSNKVNQIVRIIETLVLILVSVKRYNIAIVPLYGTPKSVFLTNMSTLLLKLLRKKIIIVLHGGSIPERMEKNPAKFLSILDRANEIVSPSKYFSLVMRKFEVKTTIIENVVNVEDYHFVEKKSFSPKVLWMRTFEDIYNPALAVKVAARLAKEFPSFKMVMAGHDKGELHKIMDQVRELQIEDKVLLPGYINREQKNAYAREMDIYICTNKVDNAPVSIIEMMNLGLPVVTVNNGGLPYLVSHNETGLVVEDDNDEAMANAIKSIINNASLGRKLAVNAYYYAQQFGEKPVITKWNELIGSLSQKRTIVALEETAVAI